MHECESEMVVKLTNAMVPYFNAPIYLDKNSKIGKVDEVHVGSVHFFFESSLKRFPARQRVCCGCDDDFVCCGGCATIYWGYKWPLRPQTQGLEFPIT